MHSNEKKRERGSLKEGEEKFSQKEKKRRQRATIMLKFNIKYSVLEVTSDYRDIIN